MENNKVKGFKIIFRNNCSVDLIDKIYRIIVSDFSQRNIQLIKSDKGHEVYRWKFKNELFYLKNYNYQSWRKKFKNIFRPVRAKKIIKYNRKLLQAGIKNLPVLCAVDYSGGIIKNKSLILSRAIPGIDLEKFFLTISDPASRNQVIRKLSQLLVLLSENNLVLGDPSLHNFIVKVNKDFDIYLIDIDNMRKHLYLPDYLFYRSLSKLLALTYSREVNISRQEKLDFIRYILQERERGFCSFDTGKIFGMTKARLNRWGYNDIIKKHEELN